MVSGDCGRLFAVSSWLKRNLKTETVGRGAPRKKQETPSARGTGWDTVEGPGKSVRLTVNAVCRMFFSFEVYVYEDLGGSDVPECDVASPLSVSPSLLLMPSHHLSPSSLASRHTLKPSSKGKRHGKDG